MLKIDFSRQAERFLRALPAKHARQIAERINSLVQDPDGVPTEELRGYAPMRRLRSGEYCIVYAIDADRLEVRLIGKRNDDDIYRQLARLKD